MVAVVLNCLQGGVFVLVDLKAWPVAGGFRPADYIQLDGKFGVPQV